MNIIVAHRRQISDPLGVSSVRTASTIVWVPYAHDLQGHLLVYCVTAERRIVSHVPEDGLSFGQEPVIPLLENCKQIRYFIH